jgi:addiction module HigA family antidote
VHPGQFVAEILEEIGLSQAAFARRIGVSRMCVSHIIRGERAVTAEMASRLGRAFGQSPRYWINLQAAYDLETLSPDTLAKLDEIEPVAAWL